MSNSTANQPYIDEYSDEWRAGVQAYNSGYPLDACPYPTGSLYKHVQQGRMSWLSGWLTQRSRIVHRRLWQRFGIEF